MLNSEKKPTYVCVYDDYGHGENVQKANAAFIVECVNNHARLIAELAAVRKALQFIADGYENHDISHVNYRVKVYQVATEVLEELSK